MLVAGGYYGYKALKGDTTEVRYVLATVEKGTLIASVSGSGQISAINKVDIKSKASGDVVYVGVKKGQEVKSGALLAQIDARDAQKSVRDAETSLETAKLELDELLEPLDELTLLQAEDSLIQAKESKQKAEQSLTKAYEDGFNAVVSAFFDLPTIMTELDDILHGTAINRSQENISAYADLVRGYEEAKVTQYKNSAALSYTAARLAYDKNFQNYKAASRYSDTATIEALVNETYEAAKKISEAIKNTDNLISFVKDTLTGRGQSAPTITATHQSTIKTDTSKTNSILSSLLSIKSTIETSRDTIISSERTIKQKELSLEDLKDGADELAVRAKKIAVEQKEDALTTAKENLANYFIRAPFDCVVADINIKKGESISSGAAVATVITKQKMAEISLNEVDVAKVKVGQKATLTFDAVEDLSITGQVAEIDTLGTVSQGVVTYNVKIVFDTQDDRVKPGMSVAASIVTDVKTNVLMAPNSSIKSSGDATYVEILEGVAVTDSGSAGIVSAAPPLQKTVQTGLANDSFTEIVSGLAEGDSIISRTITANSSAANTTQSTKGMGGGGMMMIR